MAGDSRLPSSAPPAPAPASRTAATPAMDGQRIPIFATVQVDLEDFPDWHQTPSRAPLMGSGSIARLAICIGWLAKDAGPQCLEALDLAADRLRAGSRAMPLGTTQMLNRRGAFAEGATRSDPAIELGCLACHVDFPQGFDDFGMLFAEHCAKLLADSILAMPSPTADLAAQPPQIVGWTLFDWPGDAHGNNLARMDALSRPAAILEARRIAEELPEAPASRARSI